MHHKHPLTVLCCVLVVLGPSLAVQQQQQPSEPHHPSLMGGLVLLLNHRRALRVVVDAKDTYWFGHSKATAAVTLVPAESLQKAPATKKEPKKEEQLTTAHLKQVDFNINLDKDALIKDLPEKQSTTVSSVADAKVTKDGLNTDFKTDVKMAQGP